MAKGKMGRKKVSLRIIKKHRNTSLQPSAAVSSGLTLWSHFPVATEGISCKDHSVHRLNDWLIDWLILETAVLIL